MQPDSRFLHQPNDFWALTRYVSETVGYSERGRDRLKRYQPQDLQQFSDRFVIDPVVAPQVIDYLNFRSSFLEERVKPLLLDRSKAKETFEGLLKSCRPTCALPMNKQKGEKRHYNYLICIVNILTEKHLKGKHFNDGPRSLCVVTDKANRPVKVCSRWMDGAYPNVLNPLAVWEVKEYYGTTTFGSRVADGVYETQLDGYEILEAQKASDREIKHYLIVDDRFTWWDCGKSYLCRLVDMMHMGLVDEIVFGKEVLTRWPQIVETWPEVTK